MTIAERIADSFTQQLDLQHLTPMDCVILHAIKSVSISQWARETLKQQRGI